MPKPLPALRLKQQQHSELFTVRLWREPLNDHFEWRGKVQHVISGEVHYFRDWETLVSVIQNMLRHSNS